MSESDLAGRTIRTIRATPAPADFNGNLPKETDTAEDITTDYQYDTAGRLATMTAYDAKGAGQRRRGRNDRYLYTSPLSPDLQTGAVDPGVTGAVQNSSTLDWTYTGTDCTSTTYDWMGGSSLDRPARGDAHVHLRHGRSANPGRRDQFSRDPAGAGQTVAAIGTTYDALGRVTSVTSYNGAAFPPSGGVVNQVEDAYDGWGDLSEEWQNPNGVVLTSGPGCTPSVQYSYADGRRAAALPSMCD